MLVTQDPQQNCESQAPKEGGASHNRRRECPKRSTVPTKAGGTSLRAVWTHFRAGAGLVGLAYDVDLYAAPLPPVPSGQVLAQKHLRKRCNRPRATVSATA
jgi:hypothetical protein